MSDWNLSKFSDMLSEVSNQRRLKEDQKIDEARQQLPAYLLSLRSKNNEELLERFVYHNSNVNYGFTQRKELAIIHRLARLKVRKEILRRMTGEACD